MLLRRWLSAWVLLLGALPTSRQLTPCLQQQEASPKRFVSYHQHMMPLSLAVSARPSHRLVSNVFYIFLKEVLGYDNVIFVEDKYQFNFTNTLINFISESTRSYMINLEAWKPAHFNYIPGLIQVKEFGLIAPPGWFGWWVPSNLSRIVPYLDHWRVFSSQETAGLFYQDLDHIRALAPNYKFDGVCETSRKELCNLTEYTPARCRFKQCAVLLADNPGTSGFVVDDIENLELWVRVVWVGDSLGRVVATLTQSYLSKTPGSRPPVFLDFTPSLEVPDNVAYSPIAMPLSFSETYHHKYDAHRLVKVGWSKLTQIAKPAHEALLKVTFNWADYQELLEGYKEKLAQGGGGDPIWEVACSWLKNHRKTRRSNVTGWEHWVPQEEKDTLVLGGIFPLGVGNKHSAPGSVAAMQMALDAVNSSPMVLRHYNVTMLFQDGACEADRALKSFIDIITNGNYKNLIGILGPGCSESVAPLAGLASKFNTLVISYSAEGSSFTQDKYPLFFRTIGENKQYRYVYLELLKRFNWERLAALAEDGISYTEYLTHTHDLLQANKITFIENRKFPKDWKPDSIPKYLEELKAKNARIIILDAKEAVARAVMCEAFRLGMTAKEGYVWFLPYWLPVGWYETTLKEASHVLCNTQQMLQAIDGHLSLSHQFFAPPETMTHENITVADWQERYHQRRNNRTAPSNYAGFVYDAVWTYAYAVDKLFKENQSYVADIHSDNVTNRLVQLINETDFMGVSGHIHFANGSSRVSPVNVNQWINKSHHVLATYYPSSNHSPPSLEWMMEPKWLSGGLPDDGKPPPPVCLVASLAALLNTDCEVAIVIANIIGFGFAGLFLIVGFIFIKHRYDKKVEATQQFMKSLGIDISSPSTLEGLDKWEIPRDRVVINRKLGEGAFGTVYGGEAHFTDKGWVAVAVKTLKVGSTTEEKLDFLSEAEVMKRFDHKNIVKLLGVCTKNEPIYTIMEFMLYGDLKTFLLARRHLVNEKQAEESEEVSSKKLTSMALDVARALSYLAQLRYVHRDVASRNCLVNASRVVKLGDFGMTRPMFESDYYKFNRKGMLPVRWMAPESLALGVFSPASDVWSYGVLLFEIITFGSFPFQGMSNNQVLEYVKAGHTITIPEGVKPQLENLIRSCWEQDYKKRPAASDIVEIIANNPRLLSVCLDAPLSSVQLDSEFGLSSRKFSVSLRSSDSEPLLPPGPQHIALTTIPPHQNNCHHNSIL